MLCIYRLLEGRADQNIPSSPTKRGWVEDGWAALYPPLTTLRQPLPQPQGLCTTKSCPHWGKHGKLQLTLLRDKIRVGVVGKTRDFPHRRLSETILNIIVEKQKPQVAQILVCAAG